METKINKDLLNSNSMALYEALKNLMGIYDTPLSRRRFPQDDFMNVALTEARNLISKVESND